MKTIVLTILFILLTPRWPLFAEEKSRQYETHKIKVQIEEHSYEAMVYEPRSEKIKAILIITPTIGTMDSIEGSNAQYFSKNGYLVIVPSPILTELSKPEPDLDKLDRDYYRPVVSAIGLLNFSAAKFKLPESLPVFALGASQGGITSLLLTAYVPRIKAAWVNVAGGDLPYIYAWSDVEPIVKFRKNHMRYLGLKNQSEYETLLRGYLINDPVKSCRDIKVPFHQVIALKDTSVPTVTQELLARECPEHGIKRYNVSHSGGTLLVVTKREKIKEFFESHL